MLLAYFAARIVSSLCPATSFMDHLPYSRYVLFVVLSTRPDRPQMTKLLALFTLVRAHSTEPAQHHANPGWPGSFAYTRNAYHRRQQGQTIQNRSLPMFSLPVYCGNRFIFRNFNNLTPSWCGSTSSTFIT